MIKTCVICGKTFETKSSRATVCSDECRKKKNRECSRRSYRKKQQEALRKNCAAHRKIYDEHEKRFSAVIAGADASGQSYGQYVHSQRPDNEPMPDRRVIPPYELPDVLRLKANCEQAQRLLENASLGLSSFGQLADIDRLVKVIASEAFRLYRSGVLDELEAMLTAKKGDKLS